MRMGHAGGKPFSMWHYSVHRDNRVVGRVADVQCHQHFCLKESGGILEKWYSKC